VAVQGAAPDAKAALPSAQGILDRIVNRAKLAGAVDQENKPFCG